MDLGISAGSSRSLLTKTQCVAGSPARPHFGSGFVYKHLVLFAELLIPDTNDKENKQQDAEHRQSRKHKRKFQFKPIATRRDAFVVDSGSVAGFGADEGDGLLTVETLAVLALVVIDGTLGASCDVLPLEMGVTGARINEAQVVDLERGIADKIDRGCVGPLLRVAHLTLGVAKADATIARIVGVENVRQPADVTADSIGQVDPAAVRHDLLVVLVKALRSVVQLVADGELEAYVIHLVHDRLPPLERRQVEDRARHLVFEDAGIHVTVHAVRAGGRAHTARLALGGARGLRVRVGRAADAVAHPRPRGLEPRRAREAVGVHPAVVRPALTLLHAARETVAASLHHHVAQDDAVVLPRARRLVETPRQRVVAQPERQAHRIRNALPQIVVNHFLRQELAIHEELEPG
mmetsp:Transcript_33719/g.94886  ORF Transcript_33719/g.94886 Transcript_33719/m.94886 type:complete len:407 (-) Transcript_33719:4530-5750(-)